MSLKIALVSQEYPPESAKGGIGTQTFLKAHELTALGHDVRVISRTSGRARTEQSDNGVRVFRICSSRMPAYTEMADWLCYSQKVAEELWRQHCKEPFDLVDFPEWGCEGIIHLVNNSEWNYVPTVVHLHGPLIMLARTLGWPDQRSEFFRIGTQLEAATLRLADAVFSSSTCSANWCAQEYGLDINRIPIIHTGVDTGLFYPRPIAKAIEPTIIFVGKIVRNKGVEILVEAACVIAKEFPGLRLRLLGGGEEAVIETLLRTVSARGLEQMLDLPGYVDREDLPDQLSQAHVFAAPSQYEGGPGFVYLEAMACGLPVIGCQGSGATEVIVDGENGFLVPPNDVLALADVLRRILSSSSTRDAIRARARDFVTQEADSKHCAARIAEFYQGVIADAGCSKGPMEC